MSSSGLQRIFLLGLTKCDHHTFGFGVKGIQSYFSVLDTLVDLLRAVLPGQLIKELTDMRERIGGIGTLGGGKKTTEERRQKVVSLD